MAFVRSVVIGGGRLLRRGGVRRRECAGRAARTGCLVSRAGSSLPRGRRRRLQGQPQLHPDVRVVQRAAQDLLDPAHPVAQGVPVHAQVGGGRVPLAVPGEPGAQRGDQVAAARSRRARAAPAAARRRRRVPRRRRAAAAPSRPPPPRARPAPGRAAGPPTAPVRPACRRRGGGRAGRRGEPDGDARRGAPPPPAPPGRAHAAAHRPGPRPSAAYAAQASAAAPPSAASTISRSPSGTTSTASPVRAAADSIASASASSPRRPRRRADAVARCSSAGHRLGDQQPERRVQQPAVEPPGDRPRVVRLPGQQHPQHRGAQPLLGVLEGAGPLRGEREQRDRGVHRVALGRAERRPGADREHAAGPASGAQRLELDPVVAVRVADHRAGGRGPLPQPLRRRR